MFLLFVPAYNIHKTSAKVQISFGKVNWWCPVKWGVWAWDSGRLCNYSRTHTVFCMLSAGTHIPWKNTDVHKPPVNEATVAKWKHDLNLCTHHRETHQLQKQNCKMLQVKELGSFMTYIHCLNGEVWYH